MPSKLALRRHAGDRVLDGACGVEVCDGDDRVEVSGVIVHRDVGRVGEGALGETHVVARWTVLHAGNRRIAVDEESLIRD